MVMLDTIMKYTAIKKNYTHIFDFEIGYLIKSPCKECDTRQEFPGCLDDCSALDKIHEALSKVISCTSRG